MENKFLGITPPMGWNSWNTFTWEINDKLIREAADAFVSEGLKDAGYEYVVIDDCWSEKQRDKNGKLVPDHWKFPDGIKPVADYVHSKGLKFGMYSCEGASFSSVPRVLLGVADMVQLIVMPRNRSSCVR